ncbi:capsular biosynthesis protein, partial [Campylobacter sp. RM12910]|nr:capsular biosynthesis protein [Campylobacter sp. RM12910]
YFHLSYMLGEALIKADQDKFIGGYFNLNKYIKKAKKEFKLFQDIFKEFDQINSNIIKAIVNNKQLFFKELPRIKNLLNIHKDYKPIIENIFHNFDYVTKNFNLIEEWLLSNDFNEKYKKENHPYPSLLDPKKLNDEKEKINYTNIPAELAWEMNLPLPDNYEMMWLWVACSGTVAMYTFFSFMQIGSQAFGCDMEEKVYKDSYNYLIENNINVSIVPGVVMNNSKIYYLFQKKFLCCIFVEIQYQY